MESHPVIKQTAAMKTNHFQPGEKPEGIFTFTGISITPTKFSTK
jgi:hypothetical protein